MCDINVILLGKFDILVNGKSALVHWSNSSKSVGLLKYLILSGVNPVAVSTLIDAFWADDFTSINPESALKTMVSRIRSNLAKSDPLLKDCIVSEAHGYMWNSKIPCTIDTVEFERLCKELENTSTLDEDTREKYMRILDMYGGDIACATLDEEWAMNRSVYIHNRYIYTVCRYLELLRADGDNETAVLVGRRALIIDEFDEKLNIQLLRSLKATGRANDAIRHYNNLTTSLRKNLGTVPSDELIDFYSELSYFDLSGESNLDVVRQKLESDFMQKEGVIVCDFIIFKSIYQMYLRNAERNQSAMSISLLSVKRAPDGKFEPHELALIMDILGDIMHKYLRKGDVVSHYSPSQYAILLPMMSVANGSLILERIKKYFFEIYSADCIKLIFNVDDIGYELSSLNE